MEKIIKNQKVFYCKWSDKILVLVDLNGHLGIKTEPIDYHLFVYDKHGHMTFFLCSLNQFEFIGYL
jgi:hypothetical protein